MGSPTSQRGAYRSFVECSLENTLAARNYEKYMEGPKRKFGVFL